MLQVAYIASDDESPLKKVEVEFQSFGKNYSYRLFKAACKKYAAEIEEIQKHRPGWAPKFNYNGK